MENLLNTIFPSKCLFCGRISSIFCTDCISKCRLLNKVFLLTEGTYAFNLNALCVFEYEGLVRNCIRKSKFYSKQFAALKLLSLSAAHLIEKSSHLNAGAVVIPIPSSKPRERLRGFNHVDIIADTLGKYLKLPIERRLLLKTKNTGFQYEYTRFERFQNVRGAFKIAQDVTVPEKVLLVDDICTTGATFLEAAETLYNSGVKEVLCTALSKKL